MQSFLNVLIYMAINSMKSDKLERNASFKMVFILGMGRIISIVERALAPCVIHLHLEWILNGFIDKFQKK